MAIANGFETLMLRSETKQRFYEVKKLVEKDMDMKLTHSQAMDFMLRYVEKILSDNTTK